MVRHPEQNTGLQIFSNEGEIDRALRRTLRSVLLESHPQHERIPGFTLTAIGSELSSSSSSEVELQAELKLASRICRAGDLSETGITVV
jgi:hypothetical protein